MRDIKFRAWDKKNRRMINDEVDRYILIRIDGRLMEPTPYGDTCNDFVSNSLILMQYTGLKDKNGKEIYEGDILKHHVTNGGNLSGADYFDKVTFEDGGFNIKVMRLYEFIKYSKKHNHSVEVIGNIYENPELLKK